MKGEHFRFRDSFLAATIVVLLKVHRSDIHELGEFEKAFKAVRHANFPQFVKEVEKITNVVCRAKGFAYCNFATSEKPASVEVDPLFKQGYGFIDFLILSTSDALRAFMQEMVNCYGFAEGNWIHDTVIKDDRIFAMLFELEYAIRLKMDAHDLNVLENVDDDLEHMSKAIVKVANTNAWSAEDTKILLEANKILSRAKHSTDRNSFVYAEEQIFTMTELIKVMDKLDLRLDI